MDSVRALARQVRLRRVAHALFARHASERRQQARWFTRSGRSGSFETYVVRLYLGAWVAALAIGGVAGTTRATLLGGIVVGVATVVGVRLLLVRAGFARLRVARWRRRRALDRATPHATATFRRCVAGTTDRRQLLDAVGTATDGPAAEAFGSLRRRAELEGVEAALRATARATPSPAFARLCRALCGPDDELATRLDALDTSQKPRSELLQFMTTLRTGTRPRTRRRQAAQCEALVAAIETNLRAGATLSRAVERAAASEYDALATEIDRLAGGVAVGTPAAIPLAFEQLATEVAAPSARRELRRVAAALACDCSPMTAVGGVNDDSVGDGTTATSVGERQHS